MRRRAFITLLGGAAAWPLAVRAQQTNRVRRIGVLMGTTPTQQYETYLAAFLRRLDELGWKEGRNTRTEVRWWIGGPEQMRPVVAELLAFSPDVVMVYSNLALAVLKPMVGQVPVVFTGIGDPVGDGFVRSFAHPGGNMTGFAGYDGPMGGKWLEVLKETVPAFPAYWQSFILRPQSINPSCVRSRIQRRTWMSRSRPQASTTVMKSKAPYRRSQCVIMEE
jgi:putative ABC transport system substrate-binding protein